MEYKLHSILSKLLFAIKYIAFTTIMLASGNNSAMANTSTNALTPIDCPKCHSNIVLLIEENGASHRDKITCINCHEGHPPRKRDVIPRCSKCHHTTSDTPHFGLTNCLHCHQNPHTPLKITLTRNMTAPCLTCHTSQIKELRKYPSIHTTLDCTACHIKHGFLPKCFACHASHLPEMTIDNCLGCHRPHMPLIVSYSQKTPSEFCGACHNKVYTLLGMSKSKHRMVPCVKCHQVKHKMIPKCQQCHDLPHTKSIHTKFPKCSICHGIAHNLRLNQIDMFLETKP